jgi:protein subunit release factor A
MTSMVQEVNKVILEVRAGAGGDEASLFAGDLVRMYQKYAEKRGWKFAILDANQSLLKGYKTFVGEVTGEVCTKEKVSFWFIMYRPGTSLRLITRRLRRFLRASFNGW